MINIQRAAVKLNAVQPKGVAINYISLSDDKGKRRRRRIPAIADILPPPALTLGKRKQGQLPLLCQTFPPRP